MEYGQCFFDERLAGLMPYIPCNIHVVHNTFLVGIYKYGEASEGLAIDLLYRLNSSSSRREDYIDVLIGLGIDTTYLLGMPCFQCRWLALIPALDRTGYEEMGSNQEVLSEIRAQELPKEKTLKTLVKVPSGTTIYVRRYQACPSQLIWLFRMFRTVLLSG